MQGINDGNHSALYMHRNIGTIWCEHRVQREHREPAEASVVAVQGIVDEDVLPPRVAL